jgi:hypothetical protein
MPCRPKSDTCASLLLTTVSHSLRRPCPVSPTFFAPPSAPRTALMDRRDDPVNFNALPWLSDLVDNGFQHRFFDIAVGVDDLFEDLERIGSDLGSKAKSFCRYGNHFVFVLNEGVHATQCGANAFTRSQ